MSADDLIARLLERAKNRVPEDNPLCMMPEDFLEGQAAATIASLAASNAALRVALRRIAEGNLGDATWQANYEKIREVARTALQDTGKEKAG